MAGGRSRTVSICPGIRVLPACCFHGARPGAQAVATKVIDLAPGMQLSYCPRPTNGCILRGHALGVGSVADVNEPLWRSRREAFFYLLPVGVLLVLYAVIIPLDHRPGRVGTVVELAASIGLILLLGWRKRIPLVVGGITAGVTVGMLLAMELTPGQLDLAEAEPWLPLAAPVAIYTVALYRNNNAGWALIIGLMAVVCRPWEPSADVISGGVLMLAVPALLGLYIGANRRLVHALTDRADRAEREQHLLAEQARAEERVRLAEEMHDVVTHRVSLMVLHAGALGVTATDQPTKEAAETLRVAGCEALNELRDLVGVLRNGESGAGVPGSVGTNGEVDRVPDLSTLVAESRAVGISVDLAESGNPARTSPTVGRTAYRIVQESLTNIRKHAPGASATVRIRYGGDRVQLAIHNTPATDTVDNGLSSTGSGSGLLGLRQRVELIGGTLRAGPSTDGGFEVDAILPAFVPTREKAPT
ncbi:MAG TPA: histidine kinase [Actinophytocola sp.]|uniref:sensor histidine kinase n=1 Tax=Actinophytocola sp. TaxID=1872138 RepID=UPI002DBBAD72|nr:histidine kinase [Actinophytocola sp.]HEU5471366.1 histidine kinase [Actinophytocola sp.]